MPERAGRASAGREPRRRGEAAGHGKRSEPIYPRIRPGPREAAIGPGMGHPPRRRVQEAARAVRGGTDLRVPGRGLRCFGRGTARVGPSAGKARCRERSGAQRGYGTLRRTWGRSASPPRWPRPVQAGPRRGARHRRLDCCAAPPPPTMVTRRRTCWPPPRCRIRRWRPAFTSSGRSTNHLDGSGTSQAPSNGWAGRRRTGI